MPFLRFIRKFIRGLKGDCHRGIITTYVLVFGGIFLLLLVSLLGFILLQLRQSAQGVAWAEALEVAEAGTDYYKWCLNNEAEVNCLTSKNYTDTAGNSIGWFSLEITATAACGETIQREIISTGWTDKFPDVQRRVSVLYARTSTAEYVYLLNDNVWAGADREIMGLYHSNGGIRMDGENYSLVTSAKETWTCTESFGCDPPEEKPGVFTATGNSNPDLFDFPVTSFDFDGITIDLAEIKNLVSAYPQQYYWPKAVDLDSEGKGYHVKFRSDGAFEVWIITELDSDYAYSLEEGWHDDYFAIKDEYQYGGSVSIDDNCPLIFIEDNLWLEGEVRGKVTIASANLIEPTQDTSIILPGDINYSFLDGSDGLAVIGENNILISPDSPDQMELRGIFVAQKGHFGRNHYPEDIKDKLEINGSVVSNGRVGTKWSSGGQIISGYLKRENYIDTDLIYAPSPFVPYASPDFRVVNWEELE